MTSLTESAQRSPQAMQQQRGARVSGGETGRMVPCPGHQGVSRGGMEADKMESRRQRRIPVAPVPEHRGKRPCFGALGSKVVVQKRRTLKARVSLMVRQVALRMARSSEGRASLTLCKMSIHVDKASERAGRKNTWLMRERGRRKEAW